MSSAGTQKMFCGIYSAFKSSFDEFVGEKVVSPSYSSAVLGPPPLNLIFYIIQVGKNKYWQENFFFNCFHLKNIFNISYFLKKAHKTWNQEIRILGLVCPPVDAMTWADQYPFLGYKLTLVISSYLPEWF